jgi:hypothetical protein
LDRLDHNRLQTHVYGDESYFFEVLGKRGVIADDKFDSLVSSFVVVAISCVDLLEIFLIEELVQ